MIEMIDLERALDIVRSTPRAGREETVPLGEALGRVLTRKITSPIDSPPFDKSAMDGFAIGADDDSSTLRIQHTVAAGDPAERRVGLGECARIMTGAMLPPGTGRVIRKEFTEERSGTIRIMQHETGDNVVRRGSNIWAGAKLLGPKVLAPQDIGILAASGIAKVPVAVPPRAAVISTGPEIKPPGEQLGPGQIYNSNAPQLGAQLVAMRCPCFDLGTVADEPSTLAYTIDSALASNDLVLLTGGVSEGDFDHVPRCLGELGAEILFHGVAIKPGKPTLFARQGDRWIFGLPGNPVSSFVIFEVFVKLFLYRRMGIDWSPRMVRARLSAPIRRRSTERAEFLPVIVREGLATAVAFHGSSHMNALGSANGLILVERGVAELPQGMEIDARLI